MMVIMNNTINFFDKDKTQWKIHPPDTIDVEGLLRLNNIPLSSVSISENGDNSVANVQFLYNTILRSIKGIQIQKNSLGSGSKIYKTSFTSFESSGQIIRNDFEMDAIEFVNHVEQKFLSLLIEKSLINKGDHIVIGFSGGSDSLLLLHLLNKLKPQIPENKIIAVTVASLCGAKNRNNIERLCRNYEVDHHYISESEIKKCFHLSSSLQFTLDAILSSEQSEISVNIVQHLIRVCLEKKANDLGINKIMLGLEREALLTTLFSFYTTGHPILGLYRKYDGFNEYIYPLMSIFKKEVFLYLECENLINNNSNSIHHENKQTKLTELHSGHWRGLVMLAAGHLLDAIPGIDVYMEKAYEKYEQYMKFNIDICNCKNCHSSFLRREKTNQDICEICNSLYKLGLIDE